MGAAVSSRRLQSYLTNLADSSKQRVAILLKGEEKFVHEQLEKNYRRQTAAAQATTRSLDTSRLPLKLEVMPLANSPQFAASEDLVRGSLAVVENSVFAMDKLGNIFRLENRALRKMDYGTFPSGIEKSIVSTSDPLPPNSIRALYIAYDKARTTLLVSQQKYNHKSKHVRFNISAITIDGRTLEKVSDWRTVFETEDIPNSSSFRGATGGRLVVAGNTLYFTVGDYNFGQIPQDEAALVAQNPRSSFGKIYEHDLSTGATRVKSIGHRNPQGLVFTKNGRLIDAEHGPEGGDELNIIVDGKNYGWPYKTYGTDYGTFGWPIKFRPPAVEFTEPMHAWVPSAAISPVVEISDFSERWDGDLLVGSLKAQSLFRLKVVDDRVIFSEPIWIGHRIRDIVQQEHQIILMTDDPALVFISIDEQRLTKNSKLQKQVEFIPALSVCLNCHHFGETNPSHMAPSLANILGRRIASDNFEHYSEALKKRGGTWDEVSLAKFIRSPNEFASGSTMPNPGLSQQQVMDVVGALGERRDK
jgi:cytochrome c2